MDQWLLRSCHHSFALSERLLQPPSAAGYPFTWPLLSPWAPLTAGCHNQQQLDDKSLGFRSMQTLHKHISAMSVYDASGSWRHAPPFFFSFGSLCPPPLPSVSATLILCLGFLASSSGLWSQEWAEHLFGGEPAVDQKVSDVSYHPWSSV